MCRVTRSGAFRRITDADAKKIAHDLENDDGYLAPGCGVLFATAWLFPGKRAMAAPEFESQGNAWKPHLHFTGIYAPDEVNFIEWLLAKYADNIVAHHFYAPFPRHYSIELQFGDSEMEQAKMRECRQEYHAGFDAEGRLKPRALKTALERWRNP